MVADLLIILMLLVFSAFFSGSETALTALSRSRMYKRAQEGSGSAKVALRLQDHKESLIGAILLGNNLVNIAAASLATILAIRVWGDEFGPLYATIILTITVLIFAEVLPKSIAINYSEKVALIVARPLSVIVKLLAPITALVQFIIRLILRPLGINLDETGTISSNEFLKGAIELHHNEGDVEKEDRDMLGSILDLNNREVEEVMIHRTQVYAIDISLPPEEILQQAIASSHSRIPLWRDDTDNIVGVLHLKDVLKLISSQPNETITREQIRRTAQRPWFVPEATRLSDQMVAFRKARKHFACVVDEYGAFLGIVTLEDILEEIVGDIDDEHDALALTSIIPHGPNMYRVEGTVTIRDLNRHLDWDVPDEDATTLAGLVLHHARVIPEENAVFEIAGYRFTIVEREMNQITLLYLERLAPIVEEN